MAAPFHLRPYRDDDAEAAIGLWRRSWQTAYPDIDFSARLPWWRARWLKDLVPGARIVVAECGAPLDAPLDAPVAGFVTIDAAGYLDQLVVAPEHWGGGLAAALVGEAKRLSPAGVRLAVNTDNARAIRFYEKAGFRETGRGVNPLSGRAVRTMEWRP